MKGDLVTVFGGGGFLGRYLIPMLAQKGYIVRIACRSPQKAAFLKTAGSVGQITPICADITNYDSVKLAIDKAKHVINLVGVLEESGPHGKFQNVHVHGAENVARAATEAGASSLVHISALGVSENASSKYGRTKFQGEEHVRKAFPGAAILRPSLVFGPEDQFFNRFAQMARLMPVLPIFGDGDTQFQPVYVGDVAEAALKAMTLKKAQGKTFELCGPDTMTFKELMKLMLEITKRDRHIIPFPIPFGKAMAVATCWMPKPPITMDQLRMLKDDSICSPKGKGLKDLSITPQDLRSVLPTYLCQYVPQSEMKLHR